MLLYAAKCNTIYVWVFYIYRNEMRKNCNYLYDALNCLSRLFSAVFIVLAVFYGATPARLPVYSVYFIFRHSWRNWIILTRTDMIFVCPPACIPEIPFSFRALLFHTGQAITFMPISDPIFEQDRRLLSSYWLLELAEQGLPRPTCVLINHHAYLRSWQNIIRLEFIKTSEPCEFGNKNRWHVLL